MTDSPEERKARKQEFSELLLFQVHKGELGDDIVALLADLVGKVQARERPGEINIKLVLTPGKDDDQSIYITGSVAAKQPAKKRGHSIFFVQPGNGLARTPVNQSSMFDDGMRVVGGPVRQPNEDRFRAASND